MPSVRRAACRPAGFCRRRLCARASRRRAHGARPNVFLLDGGDPTRFLEQEGPGNSRRFQLHGRFGARAPIPSQMSGAAPWVPTYDTFDFIDEFHYDAATLKRVAALLLP